MTLDLGVEIELHVGHRDYLKTKSKSNAKDWNGDFSEAKLGRMSSDWRDNRQQVKPYTYKIASQEKNWNPELEIYL